VAAGTIDQDTADARGKLDQLNDVNFRAGLSDVKNVRSQSEANKIGGSVTNLDKSQNSATMILGEAARLQGIAQAAHGNLMAAAGKQVPYKYNGQVDSTYLDPKSPLYNGGNMEVPDATIKSPSDIAKLAHGRAFVVPDGSGRIGYAP
jgi:hypothetical protein